MFTTIFRKCHKLAVESIYTRLYGKVSLAYAHDVLDENEYDVWEYRLEDASTNCTFPLPY